MLLAPNYTNITDAQKDKLLFFENYAEQFLRFLPRTIFNYPSHGVDHSLNIIVLINRFIESNWINLSEDEVFLLYISAWVHDIGCICTRDEHNAQSAIVLLKEPKIMSILGENLFTCLLHVVISHSSTFCIQSLPEKCQDIRLQLICSIFRLLDACEVTKTKCPKNAYELIRNSLNEEADEFWKAHMVIEDISLKNQQIDIHVKDIIASKIITDNLVKEIKSIESIFESNGISKVNVNIFEERY
ncbi:MAG: hypothetical protein WC343_02615 [Bacilli bacterium]|jgi:hypothetical protein